MARALMHSVLLVVLLTQIGCSNPERHWVTIRAIAPTSSTFYRPSQPIWRFAITIASDSIVVWEAGVDVKEKDQDYSHAGGHIEWPEGILFPHQSVIPNMIIPAQANPWRGEVVSWPITLQELKKAQADTDRFGPSLKDFCPRHEGQESTYHDQWHGIKTSN